MMYQLFYHTVLQCLPFQLTKKHRNGHIAKVDWLDRLTFREIEVINEKEKRNSDYLYLMIEFPLVELEGIPVS
jgi:phosphatidylinositol 3-kinase